jgi:TonB-dependent receptor
MTRTQFLKASILLVGILSQRAHGQSDDLFDGVVTPGLRFLPREVRELMIYEEPWLARTPSPVNWRTDFDERDQRRRAADVFAIQQAELYKRRIAGDVDVQLRSDDDLDGEWFDLKTYAAWFSQRDDELSWQSRIRFKVEIPDHDAGIMFYYRHRERKDRTESEHTKWAGAQNMPDGADVAFIDEHELRSSPEDEVMDEVAAVLRWNFTPGTKLLLGGSYRKQEDHLLEQRLEYDTRAGTVELPGAPPRRGYPYDSATDVVENGIVRQATLMPGVGRLERQLKDEIENKERWAAFMDFRHEYADRSWIAFNADYSKRTNREPDRQDTEFAERTDAMWTYQLDNGRPVFTPAPLPDDTFGVRKIEFENNIKQREYMYAQALVHHEVVPNHVIEGGTFALRHTDYRDINFQRFEPNPSPSANGFDAVAGGPVDSILGLNIGNGIDPAKARAYFNDNSSSLFLRPAESLAKNFAEDYDMEREIFGGHLLYRFDQEKWRVHAGARYESAKTSGTAYDSQWTGNEAPVRPPRVESAVLPTATSKTEHDLLPTLLVEYQPQRNMLFSANLRQTLQRPELREAAPSRFFNGDDGVAPVAHLGNPDLESSRQTQLILTANHAFAPGSMLRLRAEAWKLDQPLTSAGWFAPHRLDNPAITQRPLQNFRFEQTLNAKDGDLFRLGAHYAHTFHFLPHPFDQLGAFTYFDYTDSSQTATVDGNRRKTPLTYQPDLRGGGGLFYRSNRWEALLFADFHDKYLVSVGETTNGLSGTGDLWVEDRVTLNASLTYRITKDLEVYTELYNLTDTEFRMFEGSSDRQIIREKAGRGVRVGCHWFF